MDVTVDGIRYRPPLKTKNWQKAKQKEKENIQQAAASLLSRKTESFSRLGFSAAADQWLEWRQVEVAASSYKKEKQLFVQPKQYFGATPIRKIAVQSLLDYRTKRLNSGVDPVIINMEISVIGRLQKKARRWHLVVADIKPFRQPTSSVGRALEVSQKKKLLEKASSKPEWMVVKYAAQLALNTTMRGCELKNLRRKNVNLSAKLLRLEHSKTQAGVRAIPFNKFAEQALPDLWNRAKDLGSTDLAHYVFPACENGHFDPTKPQKSWRTSWRKLIKAAGLPGLRFHDLRHHAITEQAESQASDQTVLSIAGHVSRRMLDHYSQSDWMRKGRPWMR